MTRKAPPPRPRGAEWPDYRKPDGTYVTVTPFRPWYEKDESLTPTSDPGPDYTEGEEILSEFLDCYFSQHFDYQKDENGDLRQYWCPHCDQITAAVFWECEQCGETFYPEDIVDQIDKPHVRITTEMATFLAGAFQAILHGEDPKDALALKPGKKRTNKWQYYIQKQAAMLVQAGLKDMSKSKACEEVAEHLSYLTGEIDARTVANWHTKFFQQEK